MKIKHLFSVLFASALLVGCGDDVTNVFITMPDAGASSTTSSTTTNNTVNNYGASLDGGAATVINNTTNITNNYYGGGLDGGAAQAADAIPATTIDTGSVAIDTKPMIDVIPQIDTTPQPKADAGPTNSDIALLAMKGGERLFDGNNGKFAWVQADGALMAYDSLTGTGIVRQVNTLMNGAMPSMPSYDFVLSLSVNNDGRVAWMKRSYSYMDGKQWVCLYTMLDADQLYESCSVQGQYGFDGSVAMNANVVYWTTTVDNVGTVKGFWMPANRDTSKRVIMPLAASETNGLSQLRSHSYGTVGYMAHGSYMLTDPYRADAPNSATSLVNAWHVDHSATSLIVASSINGHLSVYTTDKAGAPKLGLDSTYYSNPTCTRCVALGWGDQFAVWAVSGGTKYQRIDQNGSVPTFLPGVSEFALDSEGTALYYIGPDSEGKSSLYKHAL